MPCDGVHSKMGPWSPKKFVCVGYNAVSRTSNWPMCLIFLAVQLFLHTSVAILVAFLRIF